MHRGTNASAIPNRRTSGLTPLSALVRAASAPGVAPPGVVTSPLRVFDPPPGRPHRPRFRSPSLLPQPIPAAGPDHSRDPPMDDTGARGGPPSSSRARRRSGRSLPGRTPNSSECTGRWTEAGGRPRPDRTGSRTESAFGARARKSLDELATQLPERHVVPPGSGADQEVGVVPPFPGGSQPFAPGDLPQPSPEAIPLHRGVSVEGDDHAEPGSAGRRGGPEEVGGRGPPPRAFSEQPPDLPAGPDAGRRGHPLAAGGRAHRRATAPLRLSGGACPGTRG